MEIPSDWTPTAENVNALPEPLIRYIQNMENENKVLRAECDKLALLAKQNLA